MQILTFDAGLTLPEDPVGSSVLERGARGVLQTAGGRTLLDVKIPPHEARVWPNGREAYSSPKGSAPEVNVTVYRDRGNQQGLHFHMMVKKAELAVTADELPLSVELTFDTLSAATRRCARASFAGDGQLGCVTVGRGAGVICR
jgi:hypothetical protein